MWLKFLLISCFGCCSILTTSFELGGLMSGNRMAGAPLGRSLGDGEVDVEGLCTESGLACQNCTHVVTCVPLPVGWLKVPVQECQKDEVCNAREGGCSRVPVPECTTVSQKYQHTCEQVGIFPDAYDCRKFHLCSPPEGFPTGNAADHRVGLCPRNYGYDPTSAQCSINLFKGQCSAAPVPDCTKVGDYGVLPSSPNHYYICLSKREVLYPQIFICPHGWFFWDGFCRPEPKSPENNQPDTATTEVITSSEVATESATEKNVEKTFSLHEALFSTEKPTTLQPDTFLADKYNGLFNNENYYDEAQSPGYWSSNGDEMNSWEQ